MRRIGAIAVLSMLVVALAALPALAQNVHFIKGPTFSGSLLSMGASGTVVGLGGEKIDIVLNATGVMYEGCADRDLNFYGPLQETPVNVSGMATIPTTMDKGKGSATFRNPTLRTESITRTEQTCRGHGLSWSFYRTEWTSATITIFQPAGTNKQVFQQTYQF
jgi:hypothetical protein